VELWQLKQMQSLPLNQVLHGNCLEVLKTLEGNSVDSIVTDPPYELGFMGKKWDSTGIAYNVDLWKECLRVLKPGGHLLAFGGTRTYHRMVCAIEDAGFEIRDCIMWIYGSGMPKSHNISKAIDKKLGAEREKLGIAPTTRAKTDVDNQILNWGGHGKGKIHYVTKPATKQAEQWEGWGTALKPANEPIVLARKPISEKTIAENVMKWGTGGLNIDGCRIGTDTITSRPSNMSNNNHYAQDEWTKSNPIGELKTYTGRFPANVILDEEAARMLDEQSGISKGSSKPRKNKETGRICYGDYKTIVTQNDTWGDSGGASRFFYCAKASKKERNMGLEDVEPTTVDDGRNKPIDNPFLRGKTPRRNTHPTVKPVKLMEYLITLVTPPNGIVLDPFFGSGTTGVAAVNLGFNYIGIELDEHYVEIARRRINAAGK
jgi:DNA modification methylase